MLQTMRWLQNRSSLYRPHDEGENCQREEDDKQDLRDRRRGSCNPAKSESRGSQGQNEKHKRPTEHDVILHQFDND